MRAIEVNMERRRKEGAGGNGRSPRKPADQRHPRFTWLVAGERANRSATVPLLSCGNLITRTAETRWLEVMHKQAGPSYNSYSTLVFYTNWNVVGKKRMNYTAVDEAYVFMTIVKKIENRDEVTIFGEYVVSIIQQINGPQQQLVDQRRITNIIFEIEMQLYTTQQACSNVGGYPHSQSIISSPSMSISDITSSTSDPLSVSNADDYCPSPNASLDATYVAQKPAASSSADTSTTTGTGIMRRFPTCKQREACLYLRTRHAQRHVFLHALWRSGNAPQRDESPALVTLTVASELDEMNSVFENLKPTLFIRPHSKAPTPINKGPLEENKDRKVFPKKKEIAYSKAPTPINKGPLEENKDRKVSPKKGNSALKGPHSDQQGRTRTEKTEKCPQKKEIAHSKAPTPINKGPLEENKDRKVSPKKGNSVLKGPHSDQQGSPRGEQGPKSVTNEKRLFDIPDYCKFTSAGKKPHYRAVMLGKFRVKKAIQRVFKNFLAGQNKVVQTLTAPQSSSTCSVSNDAVDLSVLRPLQGDTAEINTASDENKTIGRLSCSQIPFIKTPLKKKKKAFIQRVRKLPYEIQTAASVGEQKQETLVTKRSERPFSMFKLKLNFGKGRRVPAAVCTGEYDKLRDTKENGSGATCGQRLYIGNHDLRKLTCHCGDACVWDSGNPFDRQVAQSAACSTTRRSVRLRVTQLVVLSGTYGCGHPASFAEIQLQFEHTKWPFRTFCDKSFLFLFAHRCCGLNFVHTASPAPVPLERAKQCFKDTVVMREVRGDLQRRAAGSRLFKPRRASEPTVESLEYCATSSARCAKRVKRRTRRASGGESEQREKGKAVIDFVGDSSPSEPLLADQQVWSSSNKPPSQRRCGNLKKIIFSTILLRAAARTGHELPLCAVQHLYPPLPKTDALAASLRPLLQGLQWNGWQRRDLAGVYPCWRKPTNAMAYDPINTAAVQRPIVLVEAFWLSEECEVKCETTADETYLPAGHFSRCSSSFAQNSATHSFINSNSNSRPGGLTQYLYCRALPSGRFSAPRDALRERAFFRYRPKTIRPESAARICNSKPVIAWPSAVAIRVPSYVSLGESWGTRLESLDGRTASELSPRTAIVPGRPRGLALLQHAAPCRKTARNTLRARHMRARAGGIPGRGLTDVKYYFSSVSEKWAVYQVAFSVIRTELPGRMHPFVCVSFCAHDFEGAALEAGGAADDGRGIWARTSPQPDTMMKTLGHSSAFRSARTVADWPVASISRTQAVWPAGRPRDVPTSFSVVRVLEMFSCSARRKPTGRTLEDLKFSCHVAPQTLGKAIPDTCEAISKAQRNYRKAAQTVKNNTMNCLTQVKLETLQNKGESNFFLCPSARLFLIDAATCKDMHTVADNHAPYTLFNSPSHQRGVSPETQHARVTLNVTTVVNHKAKVAEGLACSPPTKAIRVQSPVGSLRIFACGSSRIGQHRHGPYVIRVQKVNTRQKVIQPIMIRKRRYSVLKYSLPVKYFREISPSLGLPDIVPAYCRSRSDAQSLPTTKNPRASSQGIVAASAMVHGDLAIDLEMRGRGNHVQYGHNAVVRHLVGNYLANRICCKKITSGNSACRNKDSVNDRNRALERESECPLHRTLQSKSETIYRCVASQLNIRHFGQNLTAFHTNTLLRSMGRLLNGVQSSISAESLIEARYRRQDCTPVQWFARRGDERVDAHVSVAPRTPALLGLRCSDVVQSLPEVLCQDSPEKTRRSAESPGTIPTRENLVATPRGIEPGLARWEAMCSGPPAQTPRCFLISARPYMPPPHLGSSVYAASSSRLVRIPSRAARFCHAHIRVHCLLALAPPRPACTEHARMQKRNVADAPFTAFKSAHFRRDSGDVLNARRRGEEKHLTLLALSIHTKLIASFSTHVQRYVGNTARLARRGDEALGVRVSVARIAPSLLDLGRAAT
ncbi:hypothetical protein PR048_000357 [Dryococelus australis]|uniref:Uncharacterized protein n=1 Tax=Dryococelus australis TaxID=614101 RepID=A0ABQ9IEC6_9NEOP|nr:hypothetical protein PR048_000357 [Dryococelus australis]